MFFFSLPYYTQIHQTAFLPLSPILSQGLVYFYDVILLIQSYFTTTCSVQYLSDVAIQSCHAYV